jgi:NadR type nicotinamide-nucleotide adenylyltransferase
MPISGTEVRSDLFRYRAWLDPIVYRSLIQKIVFVGTESTGKSTLSKALAERHNTLWVHEYGRELWEDAAASNIPTTFEDFWKVGQTQYAREQAASLHANKYLFCDTNAWTTYQWSKLYYGTADQKLYNLAKNTLNEYVWFMCGNEFGWVDDGQRELGENSRDFQVMQRAALLRNGISPTFLHGSIEERIEKVEKVIGQPKVVLV